MIRAVLLDLDDTLFDHLHSSRAGIEALRELHPGWRHGAETLLAEYLRLLEETHLRFMAGELSAGEAHRVRLRGLFAFAGEAADDAALEAASRAYRRAYQAARRAVPGAAALLAALRARAVATVVVTNNVLAEQVEKLRVCGLDGLVDAMVVSEEVGIRKPDPRIFALGLARAGCEPGEAAMLGDSWTNDVAGAREAGLAILVWLNRAGASCPEPTWVRQVRSLEPTAGLLAALGVG